MPPEDETPEDESRTNKRVKISRLANRVELLNHLIAMVAPSVEKVEDLRGIVKSGGSVQALRYKLFMYELWETEVKDVLSMLNERRDAVNTELLEAESHHGQS